MKINVWGVGGELKAGSYDPGAHVTPHSALITNPIPAIYSLDNQ
jgi:hypothetical protein